MTKTFVPRISFLMAAVALSTAAYAGGGEALDIELPSMRTPVTMVPQGVAPESQVQAQARIAQAQMQTEARSALYAPMLSPTLTVTRKATMQRERVAVAQDVNASLTRAEVRESLLTARAANTMSKDGEMGDTDDVLTAREEFNALQTEVLLAEAAAVQAEWVAQQELELADLIAQQQEDQKQDPELERTIAIYAPENLLQIASEEELPVLLLLFEEEEE